MPVSSRTRRERQRSGLGGVVRVMVEVAEFSGELEGGVVGGEVLFGFGVSAENVERFDGENLLREDMAELAGGLMGNVFERGQSHAFGDFEVEAGDGFVSDAARIDELEVTEIRGHIEGKSVGGDSAGDVNADGADFTFSSGTGLRVVEAAPNAGESCDATGANAIDSAEPDESFFHHANEVDWTKPAAP